MNVLRLLAVLLMVLAGCSPTVPAPSGSPSPSIEPFSVLWPGSSGQMRGGL